MINKGFFQSNFWKKKRKEIIKTVLKQLESIMGTDFIADYYRWKNNFEEMLKCFRLEILFCYKCEGHYRDKKYHFGRNGNTFCGIKNSSVEESYTLTQGCLVNNFCSICLMELAFLLKQRIESD